MRTQKIKEYQIAQLFEEAINDSYKPYTEFGKEIPASQILKACHPDEYQQMFHEYCLKENIMIVEIENGEGGSPNVEYIEVVED